MFASTVSTTAACSVPRASASRSSVVSRWTTAAIGVWSVTLDAAAIASWVVVTANPTSALLPPLSPSRRADVVAGGTQRLAFGARQFGEHTSVTATSRAATPGMAPAIAASTVAASEGVNAVAEMPASPTCPAKGTCTVAVGERLGLALGLAEGLPLGLVEGLTDGDPLGEIDGDADGLPLGEADGLALGLAEGLADGDALGEIDGDALGLVLGLVLGDDDGEVDGLVLGLPLGEMLGPDDGNSVGASVLSQQSMYMPVVIGQQCTNSVLKPKATHRGCR